MATRLKLAEEKPVIQPFEVEKGQYLYVVCQRKYIADLPDGWKKKFLYFWFVVMGRYFYFKWGTCPVPEINDKGEITFDSWREGNSVWATEEEADAQHENEHWFTQGLRFRVKGTSETAQGGYHNFSKSKARNQYVTRNLDTVQVTRSKLAALEQGAQSVVDELKI